MILIVGLNNDDSNNDAIDDNKSDAYHEEIDSNRK